MNDMKGKIIIGVGVIGTILAIIGISIIIFRLVTGA